MNLTPGLLAFAAYTLAAGAGVVLGEARGCMGWPKFRRRATGSAYLVVSNVLTLLAFGLTLAPAR